MNIHNKYITAYKATWDYIYKTGWILVWLQAFTIAIFPLAEVILRWMLGDPLHWILLIIYALHIVFAIFYFNLAPCFKFFFKKVPLSEFEANEITLTSRIAILEEGEAYLQKQYESLSQSPKVIQGAISNLQTLLNRQTFSDDIKEDILVLFTPLISLRSLALGYTADSLYNFAVYLLEGNELKIVFRKCDDRIHQNGRPWPINHGDDVGVVPYCFKNLLSGKFDTLAHNDPTHAEDAIYYQSFLFTPILKPNPNDGAQGVIVFTSNTTRQFWETHKLIIESYAVIIGMYLVARNAAQGGTNGTNQP